MTPDRERRHLAEADRHIPQGEVRIVPQQALITQLDAGNPDLAAAEELLVG